MKRGLCFLLTLSLLFLLCACEKKNTQLKAPVNFYYKAKEIQYDTAEDVIASEQRESYGYTEDYTYLVEQYLCGPRTEKCISPFPAGINLEQLDLVKNKVIIVVSSHLATITGYELTIACTCLAKTVSEMTGMKSVQIISKDSLLDGQESITISNDDYVFEDAYIPLST